ncbi:MAG: Maf family protein [Verrucomicrobiota bacterium]
MPSALIPPPLLLASTSPRRRELLAGLGLEFDGYAPPDRELAEDGDHDLEPEELAHHNVGTKLDSARAAYPGHAIIAADTVVILDGGCLGKPRDLDQARDYLSRLSGREHTVLTALGFALSGQDAAIKSVRTVVRFRSLSPDQINNYLEKVPVLDKAGAYAFQDQGSLVVEGISGSAHNVIGLPTEALVPLLQEAGYRL